MCTNCVFGTEVETEEQKNRRRKGEKNRRVEKGGVSGKRVFGVRKDFG